MNYLKVSAQKTDPLTKTTKENTFAVIVGITNYKDPAIKALQFADKDAQQFSAFLQSKGGGGVPKNNIKLIVNKQATIAAIYDALDWLKEQCKENDVAYIYFSGHGDVETKNNYSRGFLLAYNSPQNNYANNAIRVEDLNNTSIILTTKNKAKVILISDACHSGKLAGDFYKGKQLVASELIRVLNNQVRLASCKENEEAAEGPDWGRGRGIFSYYLVMGLQGLADLRNSNTIQLRDLTQYLDSSFAKDEFLIQNKHIQNPVTDGNPNYPLARIDAAFVNSLKATIAKNKSEDIYMPPGLMELEPLQPQPIDYFFATISAMPLESILDFNSYKMLHASAIPLQMVSDCIAYQDGIVTEKLTTLPNNLAKKNYSFFDSDSLKLLKNELLENKSINTIFIEKFVQSVHDKGQDMINAYIKGDMDELERRQYYYSGKRDYRKYLSMLEIALKVVPEGHILSRILQVHHFYMTGLIDRMQMALSPNTDSLLTLAFYNQQKALKMEPYAAYILNELGNLYLYKKNYDSAKYNFDLASVISPTWAIPWSNKIRMNMVFNKFGEAEKNFKTADSLQSNLAYVFTNFGMAMEKKKNLLAAESYYLRAIKINNIHFLPFEHLGYIYLKTSDFNKANYYLHEAETRKQDFSIVQQAFSDGIVQGIAYQIDADPMDLTGCPEKLVGKNETTRQYIQLLNELQKSDSTSEKQIALQELVNRKPGIPLANHYVGKRYYNLGEWKLARKALEQSVVNYLSEDDLLRKLSLEINGKVLTSDPGCELVPFLKYLYDELEDHYMLASIYEKSGENAKALAQYAITSAIENTRQSEQVTFSTSLKKFKSASAEGKSKLINQSEKFIFMAGAIKAARLHESLGEFVEAEKILLHQVSLSRAAGNAMLKKADRPQGYWLLINSYLELETYNFYKKVLKLFPRDSKWQEHAGLFLYNRLATTFRQVPVDKQREFYDQMEFYVYPWQDDEMMRDKFNNSVPGTGEKLIIMASKFDPVKESLDALNLSVKLSGDLLPHINAAKALADLNGWLGNENDAIFWFNQLLLINPLDLEERNKFINYLNEIDRLPEAYRQLDILYQQKKITADQKIQLAEWKWLSGEYKNASTISNNLNPVGEKQKRSLLILNARMDMLSGNTKNALRILLDSAAMSTVNEKKTYQEVTDQQRQNINRLYSIARLYAILQKDTLALKYLNDALVAGFRNGSVLKYDKVWDGIRNEKIWFSLINQYNFNSVELKNFININDYSTPHGLR